MGTLATATIFLNANLGALSKGLDDAEKATRKSVGNIVTSLNSIGKNMTIAGGIITGAIGGMVASSVSLGSEIADLQGKTGLSTEAISELGFAARLTGGDISTLDPAMKGLAKAMNEARVESAKTSAEMTKSAGEAQEKLKTLNTQYEIAIQKLKEMTASGKASKSSLMSQRAQIADLSAQIKKYTGALSSSTYQTVATTEATQNLNKQFEIQKSFLRESIPILEQREATLGRLLTDAQLRLADMQKLQIKGKFIQSEVDAQEKKVAKLNAQYKQNWERLKAATDQLGAMSAAAQPATASVQNVANASQAIPAPLTEAQQGFERLGLTIQQLDAMKPDERFMAVANALAGVKDEQERASVAMKVFGKSGAEMLPMLANGAKGLQEMRQKARDMGFSFDQDLINKADEFGDTIDVVKMGLQAGMMRAVGELLPQLQQLGNWIAEATKKGVEWIKDHPKQVAALGELALKIGAFLVIGGPLMFTLGKVISGFVFLKNAIFAVTAITKFGPWIAGIVGSAGGGLMGLATTLGTIVGVAGIGWMIGRWIDEVTADTRFGKWVDSMSDALVGFIDNLKIVLGLQDDIATANAGIKTDRYNSMTPEQKAQVDARVGKNAAGTDFWRGGLTWVGERGRELVNLPRGSQVFSNQESERMARAGRGDIGVQNVYITNAAGDSPRDLLRKWTDAMRLKDAQAGA